MNRTLTLALAIVILLSALGASAGASAPDGVVVRDLAAQVNGSQVLITWHTDPGDEEIESSFRLWRDHEQSGTSVYLGHFPGVGYPDGAAYKHEDTSVPDGIYLYRLAAYAEPGSAPDWYTVVAEVGVPTAVKVREFRAR